MKITRIETILLTVTPTEEVRWSGSVLLRIHTALIEVHTDEGVTGLGEPYLGIFAPEAVRVIVATLEPLLVGEDATQVAHLFGKMRAQSPFWACDGAGLAVIGAVETALWDIRGKACGLPVYELLGGRVHDRLMIYASAGLNRPLDATLEEMRRYRALGYRAVKVRVGFGLRADVEKIGSIRETIGAEMDLMVDAVQGHHPEPWTANQAIEVGRALEPFRIRWFEEPCGATDYAGSARVRDHVAIPIARGESIVSVAGFKRFLEHGSLDIVQPDTAHAGGILECQRIATLAEAYGAGIAFHCWASSAMLAPNVHLAFATPACKVVEYPTWDYPLIHDLFAEPLRIEDGCLYPPTGPGLGIRLTDEIRHKYPYRGGIGALMNLVRRNPQKYIGFMALDRARPDAIEQMEYGVSLGLKGIKLHPVMALFSSADPKIRPFFERAVELNFPVLTHMGTSPASKSLLKHSLPLLMDELAASLPDLKLIMAHLAHPWQREAAMVIRKHANVWADISGLWHRGILYLPLTSPSHDPVGTDRKGANLYGDALVALDATTGKKLWHFQTIHHDLWDWDLPAQPTLVQLSKAGSSAPGVVQVTKTGLVFVLNRLTGVPWFGVEERPVPASSIPEEQASPTQPFPLKPPPIARQSMTADELTNVTPESRAECSAILAQAHVLGAFFQPWSLDYSKRLVNPNGGSAQESGYWMNEQRSTCP